MAITRTVHLAAKTRTFTLELGQRKPDGSFPAVLSTDTPVPRRDFDGEFLEILSHAGNAVDLSRAPLPLLEAHDRRTMPIGIVENIRLDGGKLRGDIRFGTSARAKEIAADVEAGIIRNLSVGYSIESTVEKTDGKQRTITATKWTPYEASAVAIGADAGAGFGRSADDEDAVAIRALASQAKLGPAWAERMIAAGASVDDARGAALNQLTRDDFEISGHVRVGDERRDERPIRLMAEALASRFGGPAPSEAARQYTRLTVVDLARHLLEVRGVSTRMMSKGQIIERSLGGLHTTSDFAGLLTETGNRLLRAAYDSFPGGVQQVCKQSSAPDFRPVNKLHLGEAPTLKKVEEHGEFTRGTMAEGKEAYRLATFGRIFGISRQALINDDLGAFGDMATRLGRAAREFVAGELVALLVSNPTLATDSKAVFHTDHGNLTTGPGTAISVTSLGVALKSMRLQKGFGGIAINVTPKYLIVPAALETIAMQTIAAITPAQSSDVNPFAGKLAPIVDPRLDASSATAWYLAADQGQIDTIEYAYLDGAAGPEVILREGFEIDGVEWKVRLDFGAGIIDFRGLYKNAGA